MSDGDHKLARLIVGLVEKTSSTADDRLRWEQVRDGVFEISLTRNTIRIASEVPSGQYPYYFTVIDGAGRTSIDLVEGSQGFDYHLEQLYQAAKRSGTGIDAKIDELMDELGISNPPF